MPFPYYFLFFLLNFICVFSSTTSAGRQTHQENAGSGARKLSNGDDENPVIDYSRCGKSEKKAPYIWGGNNALLGDWPWMVALGYIEVNNTKPQFLCGGTLISDEWIITAAHCVINEMKMLIIARVGDLNLNDHGEDKATPIDVPISEMYPHPEYTDAPVITNDIALLKLWKRVHFQKLIRPICLLNKAEHMDDEVYSGQNPYILGWGSRGNKNSTLKSNSLQEATVQILDPAQCKRTFLRRNGRIFSSTIDHRVLCATSDKADACKGASGGPMIMPIGNTYYLAGVISYGDAICGGDGTIPGVYTKVASYTDWIRNVTQLSL